MKRFYEFCYDDLKKVILSSEAARYIDDLKIAVPLVRIFLKDQVLTIDSTFNNGKIEHTFKSKCEEVKMDFHDNLYFLYYNEMIIGFSYDFNNNGIIYEIKYYAEMYDDAMYVEKFDTHSVDIFITYNSRELELFLPLDTTKTIDTMLFRETKSIDDIESLKRYYFANFFDKQTLYDKKSFSVLRIFRYISNVMDLTDELIISEGFIHSYLISTVKDDFILSVKKPKDGNQEFTFNKIPQENLDINVLARKLEKQASFINFRL